MHSQKEVVRLRLAEKLERECGSTILQALRDPTVVEILLNPDGQLWVDVAGHGMRSTGQSLDPGAAESILTTCATILGRVQASELTTSLGLR